MPMLTISKKPPPRELEAFKQKQRKAGIEPRYADLRGSDKAAVQKALLTEQGFLCAYCMKLIDSEIVRIEHWKAQSADQSDHSHELDFSNLLGVCGGKIDFTPNTEHPDHLKNHCEQNRKNIPLTVRPTDARLVAQIKFTENGVILSENSNIQKDLDETLNLNIQTLKRNREKVWEGVKTGLDLLSRKNQDKKWSKPVVDSLVQKFSEKRPDESGNLRYSEYCGIILYLLKKRLARM